MSGMYSKSSCLDWVIIHSYLRAFEDLLKDGKNTYREPFLKKLPEVALE